MNEPSQSDSETPRIREHIRALRDRWPRIRVAIVTRRWLSVIACGTTAISFFLFIYAPFKSSLDVVVNDIATIPYPLLVGAVIVISFTVGFARSTYASPRLTVLVRIMCWPSLWIAIVVAFCLLYLAAQLWNDSAFLPSTSHIVPHIWWLVVALCAGSVFGLLLSRVQRWLRRNQITSTTPISLSLFDSHEALLSWLNSEFPIDHPELDCFGHSAVARRIARRLLIQPPGGQLPPIALYGAWGSGKSTIIKLTMYYLENPSQLGPYFQSLTKSRPEVRLVSVSSWGYSTYEAAIKTLVGEAINELGREVDDLSVAGSAGGIADALTAAGGFYSALSKIVSGRRPIERILSDISDICIAINLRIVLCIEDVDRNRSEHVNAGELEAILDRFQRCPGMSYILTDRER